MEKPKYTTTFSCELKPLVSEEKDKYLAMASLLEVGEFIPDINTADNMDLLPVAFNAFVANRVNKNGDVVDTDLTVSIYKSFINKPINIEHNREHVVGFILAAGFSEFGTDNPLTEEEVKGLKGPFNVTLGGVIWKTVNDRLSSLIEESNDPTSQYYKKVSASWELGFDEFNLIAMDGLDKNTENGQIIDNPEEITKLQEHLKAFGGGGVLDDGRLVYRQVINNVLPLGIGLTEHPAADVEGVAVKNLDKTLSNTNNKDEDIQLEEKSSHNIKINVKKDSKIMKITSLKDITDDSLKEMSASAVSDFIENELKEASLKFSAEKSKVDDALKEVEEKHTELSKDNVEMKTNVEALQTELDHLTKEKDEREAAERFNQRMASFDEDYDLTDEDREVIASDVKELGDDDFSAYQKKMSVLLRNKNKEVLAVEKEKTESKAEKAKEEVEEKTAITEADTKEEVEGILDETVEEKSDIPATSEASEPSVYDKYKQAFGLDQFEIKTR